MTAKIVLDTEKLPLYELYNVDTNQTENYFRMTYEEALARNKILRASNEPTRWIRELPTVTEEN